MMFVFRYFIMFLIDLFISFIIIFIFELILYQSTGRCVYCLVYDDLLGIFVNRVSLGLFGCRVRDGVIRGWMGGGILGRLGCRRICGLGVSRNVFYSCMFVIANLTTVPSYSPNTQQHTPFPPFSQLNFSQTSIDNKIIFQVYFQAFPL